MIRKKLTSYSAMGSDNRRPLKEQRLETDVIAGAALSLLSDDPAQLARFLDVTGLTVASLRTDHSRGVLMPALLHYVLHDEELLVRIAKSLGRRPEVIADAASNYSNR